MDWIFQILTTLAMALGDPSVPSAGDALWSAPEPWREVDGNFETKSTSTKLAEACGADPEALVVTPVIIQGYHSFYGDGQLIHTSRQHKAYGSSMNNSAAIPCLQFQKFSTVEWRVVTNTRSYAALKGFPTLHERVPFAYTLTHVTPIATAGILFIMGVAIFALFSSTTAGVHINRPFLVSNILSAGHFALTTPQAFGIEIPELHLHRTHDLLIWTGVCFLWHCFRVMGMASAVMQRLQIGTTVGACAIILTAQNLSQSQVGSTLAFMGNSFMILFLVPNAMSRLHKSHYMPKYFYQLLAIFFFSFGSMLDFGTHLGFWSLPPLYAIGYLGPFVFVALAINEEIVATYTERDSLRKGLELKVEEKTRELKTQSLNLEIAYNDLQNLKADAVQSARLAALGTLSAGIAHEINNSLNYVNGSLTPLRNLVAQANLSESEKKKATSLFGLMDEGLTLTFSIIKNLKNQAGTGNGEMEDVPLKALVDGTLLLLRNKLPQSIEVRVNIDSALKVRANQTGVTQVATNLVGNAIDALVESKAAKGRIDVVARQVGDSVEVSFKDNGPGIPKHVLDRIFEPFFTTKAEGKGTGLGLHLVRTELEKMHGSIRVETKMGEGTEFIVTLRCAASKKEVAA